MNHDDVRTNNNCSFLTFVSVDCFTNVTTLSQGSTFQSYLIFGRREKTEAGFDRRFRNFPRYFSMQTNFPKTDVCRIPNESLPELLHCSSCCNLKNPHSEGNEIFHTKIVRHRTSNQRDTQPRDQENSLAPT